MRVDERFAGLSPAKLALVEGRLRSAQGSALGRVLPRAAGRMDLPLSFAQQRLWFLDRLQPGSAVYTVPASFRIRMSVDVPALQRSLNEIVRRHESLRTTFRLGDLAHASLRSFVGGGLRAPRTRAETWRDLTIGTPIANRTQAEAETGLPRAAQLDALSDGEVDALLASLLGAAQHSGGPQRQNVSNQIPALPRDDASTFAGWQALLPKHIHVSPVQLPARQSRLSEAPFTRVEPTVQALADVLQATPSDRPFALFGHSMGALVRFELARELRRRRADGPATLLVASCRAPQMPILALQMAGLPDAAFLAALDRFSGLPPGFLDHPELVDLVLPGLRADVALCEAYEYVHAPPLECAISAYGSTDPNDVSFPDLAGWRQQTLGALRTHTFRGSHFFLSESRPGLLKVIQEDLSRIVG